MTDRLDESKHVDEMAERIRCNQERLASNIKSHYDYIVCGSGSSGSVIAGRLAANPDLQILLLEAGGEDSGAIVTNPNFWVRALGSELDWKFQAEPNPALNGRAIPYSMGKVLGGGSSINVGTWSRGHKADWDYFAAAAGDRAWDSASVLEVYRRIEDWHGPSDPAYRAVGGPVYVQPAQELHAFSTALLEASKAHGVPQFENPNGAMMEAPSGCSVIDEIVRNGSRQSIFRAYVYPRMGEQNLTVLTGALVQRIVFEETRAAGVEVSYNGRTIRIDATHEVIVSLGAIQTPKLLMQSGIGDTEELARFGIPPIQHLPGVGKHLHDHLALGCTWEAADVDLPTAPRSQVVSFWKTRSELDAPNMFVYSKGGPAISPENAAQYSLPKATWALILGMRPKSRGSVHLTGPQPTDPVSIDAGYLRDARDLQDIEAGLQMCRDMGNSSAFQGFTKREVAPESTSQADVMQYVRNGLGTFWHQSGTVRMGADEGSVVDSKCRVYGVEGLRVADASILPRVSTGNTMAPCVVIGEQAAHFLQQA